MFAESYEFLRVRSEEYESGKTGRADSVTFGNRLGGVTDGVKRVGNLADIFWKVGHFGDTAGVVGNRSVGVNGHNNTRHGKHRNGRDCDTVESGIVIRNQNSGDNRK